ncbi:hypothetical protein SAMN05444266_104490 [Chitinophaga jiangningensis]|uniref:MoxR-vWA-beta-propeller ternary system domain-containing protein n=1 Tax=Chitinophaga jiangningensis TaxID=1419482 RepID=A0A1M7CUU4_9BACT|nr:hypothetical protein [Chitinophaga jiangningensis]SHL71098.1 hypothetical protein SAMN05444266_104490 [Chitinophaga jiangningensis]
MNLAIFITTLIQDGKVSVDTDISPFSADVLQETVTILQSFYHNDVPDMPGTAPAFHADAAIWGATYIYRTAQLFTISSPEDEDITRLLVPFSGAINAATIYSADLSLRYLPDLAGLNKSHATNSKLLEQLQETAAQWPFSSTGMKILAAQVPDSLLQHPSLLAAYADRIIVTRDHGRLRHPKVLQAVVKALDNYQEILWPGFTKP